MLGLGPIVTAAFLSQLGKITKNANNELRALLIPGARFVSKYTPERSDALSRGSARLKPQSMNRYQTGIKKKEASPCTTLFIVRLLLSEISIAIIS